MISSVFTAGVLMSLAIGQQSEVGRNPTRPDSAKKKSVEPGVAKKEAEKATKIENHAEPAEYKSEDVAAITKADGRTVTVKGKIFSVFQPRSGKLAILNFGGDHRICFKAVIESKDFAKFNGADGIVKSFEGKHATVVGKVKLYRAKPEIFIDEPKQITAE